MSQKNSKVVVVKDRTFTPETIISFTVVVKGRPLTWPGPARAPPSVS